MDNDFIPDSQFIPDAPASRGSAMQAPTEGADFIPDSHFVPDTEKYGSTLEQLKAGAENVASAGTFGLSTGAERLFGAKPEDIRGRHAAHEELHPWLTSGENVLGYGASALIPGLGEANIVGGAEAAAAKGIGSMIAERTIGAGMAGPLTQGANAASSILGGIAKGGVGMALMAGGDEMSKMFSEDPGQTIGSAAANIGLSGLLGAGIGAPLGAVSPAWNALKGTELAKKLTGLRETGQDGQMSGLAKQAIHTFFDVSPENAEKYLADREAINAAPEMQTLYDHYFPQVEAIHKAVTDNAMDVKDAELALSNVKNQYSNDLRQKGFEVGLANKEAQKALKVAAVDLQSKLKENALNQAPVIVGGLDYAHKQIIDQSRASAELLENSGAHVDMMPLYNAAEAEQAELRSRGKFTEADNIKHYVDQVQKMIAPEEEKVAAAPKRSGPADWLSGDETTGVRSPSKNASTEQLEAIKKENYVAKSGKELSQGETDDLLNRKYQAKADKAVDQAASANGMAPTEGVRPGSESVSAVQAKKLIQGLNDKSQWGFGASEFDKGLSRSYKSLRFALDDTLKNAVPEYREAMKPVAELSQFLGKMKKFDTLDKATRSINSIGSPTNKGSLQLLRELEQKTGSKFMENIETYANKDSRKGLIKNLPEYADADKISKVVEALKNPETKRLLEEQIAKTPEFQKHAAAIKAFEDAVEKKQAIGGVTPTNLETWLKGAMRGKRNVESAIQNMPKYEGKPLEEVLANLKTKQAFEGGRPNGSKNVNLFGGIGAAIGAMSGHVVGGASAGAAAGAFMDKNGHAVAKKILDYHIDHAGDLGKLVDRSSKSSLRFAVAKMMDAAGPVSPAAFNAINHLAVSAMAGHIMLQSNSKKVFDGDKLTVPVPDKEKIKKLDEKLKSVQQNPMQMMNNSGDMGQALPDHAEKLAQTTTNAATYLNGLRPVPVKAGLLDADIKTTNTKEIPFQRSLAIAENPLSILHRVKDGTILPQDVATVKTIYPDYHAKISQELTNSMIDHIGNGGTIPYRLRQSLSMFLGQPMDSTMTQQSMQAIIGSVQAKAPTPQEQHGKPTQMALKQTEKVNKLDETPLQARQMNKKA